MSSGISCGTGLFSQNCDFLNILIRKMDLEAHVRAKIARRLKRRGAQTALASKLTTHGQSWLNRYLSGELGMDLPTLADLARIWQIEIAEIIGPAPLPVPTPEQVEAQEIAEAWPWLDAMARQAYRTLILDLAARGRQRQAITPPGSNPGDQETMPRPQRQRRQGRA